LLGVGLVLSVLYVRGEQNDLRNQAIAAAVEEAFTAGCCRHRGLERGP